MSTEYMLLLYCIIPMVSASVPQIVLHDLVPVLKHWNIRYLTVVVTDNGDDKEMASSKKYVTLQRDGVLGDVNWNIVRSENIGDFFYEMGAILCPLYSDSQNYITDLVLRSGTSTPLFFYSLDSIIPTWLSSIHISYTTSVYILLDNNPRRFLASQDTSGSISTFQGSSVFSTYATDANGISQRQLTVQDNDTNTILTTLNYNDNSDSPINQGGYKKWPTIQNNNATWNLKLDVMASEEWLTLLEVYHLNENSTKLQMNQVGRQLADKRRWKFDERCDLMRRSDLKGLHIRVVYPAFMFIPGDPTGLTASFQKAADIIGLAIYTLNASIATVVMHDANLIGSANDEGEWTGYMGMLQRREADITFLSTNPSSDVKAIIDVSAPYRNSDYRLYVRKPEFTYSLSTTLSCFTLPLWLVSGVMVVSLGLALHVITDVTGRYDIDHGPPFNLTESWLKILGDVCVKGWDRLPVSISGLVLCVTSLVFGYMINLYYVAQLQAGLTAKLTTMPFTDLDGLVDTNVYNIILYESTYPHDVAKTATSGAWKRVHDLMVRRSDSFYTDFKAGLERVCHEKTAMMALGAITDALVKQASCDIVDTRESFFTRNLDFPIRKGFQYGHLISYYIRRSAEGGLLNRYQSFPVDDGGETDFEEIEFIHVIPFLLLYGCAISFSSLVLFLELCHEKVYGRQEALSRHCLVIEMDTEISIETIEGVFGGDAISYALYQRGFKLGKTIGEGSYCKVKAALKTLDNGITIHVACKSIDKKKASDDYVGKFLPREISIIRHIVHPNIVQVLDILEMDERVFVFMEICCRGDLLEFIRARGALTEPHTKMFFRQMISAVDYLHRLDISHRDLKCENILLASKNTIKIADFGFARWCRDNEGRRILSRTFCGSAAYAAPEILQGTPYNPNMYDIWSLGCVLFIMLTATMPFDDTHVNQMLKVQLNHLITFPSRIAKFISTDAKKLIKRMLEPDITKRININQIQRHDWLKYKKHSARRRI